MKSIQQRLQSRISKRRNYIAQLESDATFYKTFAVGELRYIAKNIRASIKPLAADQKLDKELFNYMVGLNSMLVREALELRSVLESGSLTESE